MFRFTAVVPVAERVTGGPGSAEACAGLEVLCGPALGSDEVGQPVREPVPLVADTAACTADLTGGRSASRSVGRLAG